MESGALGIRTATAAGEETLLGSNSALVVESTGTDSENRDLPSFSTKFFFWVLLGNLSYVLPELISFNTPFPYANPIAIALGETVYGFHVLVLCALMFKWPIYGLKSIFAYGGIFGLYESFITKMVWNPSWGQNMAAKAFGVSLFHTFLLVFVFHPLEAFLLPLLICELLLVRPGRLLGSLPRRLRSVKGGMIFLGVASAFCGLEFGGASAGWVMLGIPILPVVVIGMQFGIWRYHYKGHRFYLEDLLPQGRSLKVLAGLLLLEYVILTPLLRNEALPRTVVPYISVIAIYLFFALSIFGYTRRAKTATLTVREPLDNGKTRNYLLSFLLVFFSALLLQVLLGPNLLPIFLIFFIIGFVNILFLAWSIAGVPMEEWRRSHSHIESQALNA